MFNWFRKKEQNLEFRDNVAAFTHACSIGYTPLIGGLIPALVEEDGGGGRDGERAFLISVAGPQGAAKLWSCTLKESLSYPKEGDFVGFRIVTIASDLPEPANLIGYIACRITGTTFITTCHGYYAPHVARYSLRWCSICDRNALDARRELARRLDRGLGDHTLRADDGVHDTGFLFDFFRVQLPFR